VTVDVLYFASLSDRTGTRRETVEVAAGTDVAGLWDALCARHPALAGIATRPMVACDREYAGWDRPVDGVREVAFLPQVSGG